MVVQLLVLAVPFMAIVEVPAVTTVPVWLVCQDVPPAAVLSTVKVPLPSLTVLVPLPLSRKPVWIVGLLLLTLKSRIHPAVVPVQPKVIERTVKLVLTVIVQVVPPTQVAASKITASTPDGTDAPVAPPVVVDHMAVLAASQVQVVVHTANRLAAWAAQGRSRVRNSMSAARRFMLPSPTKPGSCH